MGAPCRNFPGALRPRGAAPRGDETREVGPGDTLLKQNGVMHGCVCLEAGILLDFFTPMREDFV